jgi:hypothetical protein
LRVNKFKSVGSNVWICITYRHIFYTTLIWWDQIYMNIWILRGEKMKKKKKKKFQIDFKKCHFWLQKKTVTRYLGQIWE